MLKKARLLWLKKLQGVRQIAHLKQQRVLSFFFYITHKDFSRKSYVFICYLICLEVKIVLYLHFLYTKDDRLWQSKKKHDWWNNCFSDCNWTRTHNHLVHKRTLNCWVFVYELSRCGLEFSCSHLTDFAPASSKEFPDIQTTIECGFTLKRVLDMTRTYNRFSDVFTYCLNLKHFASLFFLTKDNFMFWIKSLFFSFNLSY